MSTEELQKIAKMLETVQDPATAVFDLIEQTSQGFEQITSELEGLNQKIDDAVANKIDGKDGIDGESIKGDQGEKGDKGDKGDTGAKGESIKGDKGEKGDKGDPGESIQGIPGINGETPKHEWKGTRLRFELPSGKWGDWVDLQGETGRALFGGGGSSHVQVGDATGLVTNSVQTLSFRTGLQVTQIGMETWVSASGSGIDHGLLTGLSDDDHPQYLLKSGGTMTGPIDMNGEQIQNSFLSIATLASNLFGGGFSIEDLLDINLDDGGQIKTGTGDGEFYALSAYDVDGAFYSPFLYLTAGNTPKMELYNTMDVLDNTSIRFGSVATFSWDTTDANANMFKHDLPAGGAVDVPVYALGVGLTGVDLGLFNGTTQTRFALFNATDTTEYTSLSYNPTSGFGGTAGIAELTSTGDMNFIVTGSLAGTTGFQVNPPTGSTKILRVVYRGGVNGNCRFEFGEQGASGLFIFANAGFDQSSVGVSTLTGRQFWVGNSGNMTNDRDFDVPVMDDPVFGVQTSLNVNTDHSEVLSISAYGIRGGYISNANFISSNFAMETDRAPLNWIFGPANCRQNASSQANKTGATLDIYAGDGNILDSTSGIGGKIILHPGSQDDDNNGEPGRVEIDLPQSTAQPNVGGTLLTTVTEVGNVGTGEDTLITYSLPAFTLQKAGDAVRVTAWGTYAANVNTKRVKLHFGGTATADTTALAISGGSWRIVCEIFRDTATTQKAIAEIITNNALLVATSSYTAPGETLSGAVTIKCTGEATSNNDIVQEGMLIEYLPANS